MSVGHFPGTRDQTKLGTVIHSFQGKSLKTLLFLVQVGPCTKRLLILGSFTAVEWKWYLFHSASVVGLMTDFIWKSYCFSKNSVLTDFENWFIWKWHDTIFQPVAIFCSLEALSLGYLCSWFYYMKLFSVVFWW